MRCFHVVTTKAKKIVDRTMGREKALGMARRLKPPHLAFTLPSGLV